MRSTELFRSVEPAALEELVPELRIIELSDAKALITQGDHDQNLYLLMAGRLRIIGYDQRGGARLLLEVSPGESVGEMSVLSDDRASTTVLSVGESRVLAVPREAFDRFSTQYPQAALQVMQSLSGRLQKYRLSTALHLSNLFDSLDADVLHDLEQELEMFTLYGGEVLFRQGDPGDFLCLVIRGRVRVRVGESGPNDGTVAELGSGEVVGEMAVVTGESRTATVQAMRDTQLAKLSRAGFERFMTKHPRSAVLTVSRTLAERLRDTTAGHARRLRSISTVAIVPAHTGAPLREFCEALKSALDKFGTTLHLSSARVDEHLGRVGISQAYERAGNNIRVVEWLSNQEMANDYVLYEADQFLSPWTERCVRQADHILVVGDSAADPAPGEIEGELLGSRNPRDRNREWLVLVQREGNPQGTRRWLDARTVERHFHVHLDRSDGFERVARFLTGRAVGLTLGGGFARGLAHVGVFHAFADLGISVDAIGGASMGAMIGALRAMGWDDAKIVREISAGCAKAFDDLTFPFIAFKTGKKFSEVVRGFFGDMQIEDLWLPYFCISANLNRSELKIHTRGPLAKAILATTRAPGLFPPVVYEGELHIDGGVINNVPVDIMKAFSNEGITVGVDVSPPHELHPVRDYGDDVPGWQAFWKRLNPFSKHRIYTPSILLVMIRTLEYSGISYKSVRLQHADMYMYPELLRFKRTDFHLAPEIVKAGYDCARANVLEWLSRPGVSKQRPDLADTAAARAASAAASDRLVSEAI
ncbi:MAG: cyclic nucleotide-binding domain-containing protein [Acidobacteriia bacterium]|nr:cyclic nucleotide-binding domain-containing protein [Terriglobia bacterium]